MQRSPVAGVPTLAAGEFQQTGWHRGPGISPSAPATAAFAPKEGAQD